MFYSDQSARWGAQHNFEGGRCNPPPPAFAPPLDTPPALFLELHSRTNLPCCPTFIYIFYSVAEETNFHINNLDSTCKIKLCCISNALIFPHNLPCLSFCSWHQTSRCHRTGLHSHTHTHTHTTHTTHTHTPHTHTHTHTNPQHNTNTTHTHTHTHTHTVSLPIMTSRDCTFSGNQVHASLLSFYLSIKQLQFILIRTQIKACYDLDVAFDSLLVTIWFNFDKWLLIKTLIIYFTLVWHINSHSFQSKYSCILFRALDCVCFSDLHGFEICL